MINHIVNTESARITFSGNVILFDNYQILSTEN